MRVYGLDCGVCDRRLAVHCTTTTVRESRVAPGYWHAEIVCLGCRTVNVLHEWREDFEALGCPTYLHDEPPDQALIESFEKVTGQKVVILRTRLTAADRRTIVAFRVQLGAL